MNQIEREIEKINRDFESHLSIAIKVYGGMSSQAQLVRTETASAITRHILSTLPKIEELTQSLLDAMMKEARRNNNGKSYHKEGYKYTPICSCGSCHMSNMLARTCLASIRKGWGCEIMDTTDKLTGWTTGGHYEVWERPDGTIYCKEISIKKNWRIEK